MNTRELLFGNSLWAMNEPTSAHELIMVTGVQRSGTNVLFDSLATDRTLSAFPEDIDSEFYCNFRFRKPSFYPLTTGTELQVLLGLPLAPF